MNDSEISVHEGEDQMLFATEREGFTAAVIVDGTQDVEHLDVAEAFHEIGMELGHRAYVGSHLLGNRRAREARREEREETVVPDGGEPEDDLEDTYELRLRGRKADLIEVANVLTGGLIAKSEAGHLTPPDHRMIHELVEDLDELLEVDAANRAMESRLETGDVLVGDHVEPELVPVDDVVTDGGVPVDDPEERLLELSEEFEALEEQLTAADEDPERVIGTICGDLSLICIDMAGALEDERDGADEYRIDNDQMLTDGGQQPPTRGEPIRLREHPGKLFAVLVGVVAWAVFLWWVSGGMV